jgi:RecA-family ATPase
MNADLRPNPFGQYLDIRHILTTSPPAQDPVLPGLLAGTAGMLAGPGGIGKTMFELQVALAVACGGSICGGLFESGPAGALSSRKPGVVVLVTAEETVDIVWSRLHAIVATLFENKHLLGLDATSDELMELWAKNLRIYPLGGRGRVTLLDQYLETTSSFIQLSDACDGARLVILDPVRQFHTLDENDSGSMTALVQAFQQIAAKTRAALIFAHHVNRASTQAGLGDTAGAARGSTALSDGVRWQLNLSEPGKVGAKQWGIAEEDRHQYACADIAKANYLPRQDTQLLERLPGGVLVLSEQSREVAKTRKPGSRQPKPAYPRLAA